jgi:predicted aldo/keto reductase-like oxidoreductase
MIQKRLLGKTGEHLSIIGFGGILVSGVEQSEANAIVREAIDRGINYFDVAPSYGDAEEHLGPALEEFRKDVFLACKTTERQKEGAVAELHESLRKLRTDHFDLYQLHGMTTREDFEQVFAPGGAIEAFIEAREEGLIRYIGFSAHSAEIALALMDRFDFDTVLFPLNWVNYLNANFGPQVVAKAKSQNMGILALKAMARTQWAEGQERTYSKCWYEPVTDPVESELAIRFTLSEPITAAVTPGHVDLFRRALEVAENFQPLSDSERDELRRRAEGLKPIFQLADAA